MNFSRLYLTVHFDAREVSAGVCVTDDRGGVFGKTVLAESPKKPPKS
jgi:hypothetical protein